MDYEFIPGYYEALLRERGFYVVQDKPDRVADVDAELARFEADATPSDADATPTMQLRRKRG